MGYFPPQGTMGPQSPPPRNIPPKPSYPTYIVDCLYQNTYVWLRNGNRFWFYPTRVEYGEISGYRWNGAFWQYYGIDPRMIETVSCYPTPALY